MCASQCDSYYRENWNLWIIVVQLIPWYQESDLYVVLICDSLTKVLILGNVSIHIEYVLENKIGQIANPESGAFLLRS